ncbi:hypothetical protein SEPCBS57363_006386 [Sporothrix epigloea]|uniref:Uncharacterized protein n=1 Tax=Sporothrix epigloea TaxID=1892477 RepID=A0ABP0E2S2_9PEZI
MRSPATSIELPDISRLRIDDSSPEGQHKVPAVPPAPTPNGERQQMAVSSQDVTYWQGPTDGQGRADFGQERGHNAGQRQGTRGRDAPRDRLAGHDRGQRGHYGDNGGTGGQNAGFSGYGGPPQHHGFQGFYGGGGFQGQYDGGGFQGHRGGDFYQHHYRSHNADSDTQFMTMQYGYTAVNDPLAAAQQKVIGQLDKSFPKENRYQGPSDTMSLMARFLRFQDACIIAGITKEYLHMALPVMMAPGRVRDFCMKEALRTKNWNEVLQLMQDRYEDGGMRRERENRWLLRDVAEFVAEKGAGLTLAEQAIEFFNEMEETQTSLSQSSQSEKVLLDKLEKVLLDKLKPAYKK